MSWWDRQCQGLQQALFAGLRELTVKCVMSKKMTEQSCSSCAGYIGEAVKVSLPWGGAGDSQSDPSLERSLFATHHDFHTKH